MNNFKAPVEKEKEERKIIPSNFKSQFSFKSRAKADDGGSGMDWSGSGSTFNKPFAKSSKWSYPASKPWPQPQPQPSQEEEQRKERAREHEREEPKAQWFHQVSRPRKQEREQEEHVFESSRPSSQSKANFFSKKREGEEE